MDALHNHKMTDNCNIHTIRRPVGLVGPDISGGPREDIRPHEILGMTYRVKICSSSFKRTREFSRTFGNKAQPAPTRRGRAMYVSSLWGGWCYLKVQPKMSISESQHPQ